METVEYISKDLVFVFKWVKRLMDASSLYSISLIQYNTYAHFTETYAHYT